MKPTPKQTQEAVKNYEKLVEHLITENYAEDKESADNIIKGMSEEWFNTIISE
jgi:hypothetical protein